MRIAIDISSVVYGTGVSMYAKNLVMALAKIDRENEYVLFGGTWRQKDKLEIFFKEVEKVVRVDGRENFQLKIFPIPPRVQSFVWNDLHFLSLEKLLGSIDIYHSIDWSLAPTKAKVVITVHDLFFLKCPDLQKHPHRKTMVRRLKRARNMQIPAIAVSETTKDDLVELLDYPEKLVTVVYEAVDGNLVNDKLKIKDNSGILNKYGIEGDYLFMVGTQEPRKNLKRVIEVFSKLEIRNLKLVIAGKVGWGEKLKQVKNVKLLGYVSDKEKFVLMKNAIGFLYPSLYEGFGIPILESFACGVPVLTSNISSMPEVAGDVAIYVDPYDIDSLHTGIGKMVNLNKVNRKRLIENGFKQLKKFSWEKMARETLEIYRNL